MSFKIMRLASKTLFLGLVTGLFFLVNIAFLPPTIKEGLDLNILLKYINVMGQ